MRQHTSLPREWTMEGPVRRHLRRALPQGHGGEMFNRPSTDTKILTVPRSGGRAWSSEWTARTCGIARARPIISTCGRGYTFLQSRRLTAGTEKKPVDRRHR